MNGREDDIVALLLQGKREYEAMLKQNDSLRNKCHALEMQCDRLKDESESLHKGDP